MLVAHKEYFLPFRCPTDNNYTGLVLSCLTLVVRTFCRVFPYVVDIEIGSSLKNGDSYVHFLAARMTIRPVASIRP